MCIESTLIERIDELAQEIENLSYSYTDSDFSTYNGLCTALAHVIQLTIPDKTNLYRKKILEITLSETNRYTSDFEHNLTELFTTLQHLQKDIKIGLISSITDRAKAETFDNFLDHAKSYLSSNQIKESGVIAGVVFEDSIRRICDKYEISQKGRKLDKLIDDLVKAQKITQMKAKRAKASAHVRTKATHAQWDEFDERDVQITIDFTEEIILNHLDS